nr:Chain B, VAL-CYS-ILE-GLY-THR-PRO-ILE-SER-PHE-TYR-CYS [Escherichia coli]
VCIGTPISFYC